MSALLLALALLRIATGSAIYIQVETAEPSVAIVWDDLRVFACAHHGTFIVSSGSKWFHSLVGSYSVSYSSESRIGWTP